MKQTFSYWEKDILFENVDLVIVGGGIVGVFTALEIRRLHPNWKIIILERGVLPNGASTKNAGFSCFGSLSELLDDLNSFSIEESLNLVKLRISGLNKLRQTLGDENIGFNLCGGFELFTEKEQLIFEKCCDKIDEYNDLLKDITGLNTFSIEDNTTINFGFSSLVKNIIKNKYEGSIHTGKLYLSLNKIAANNDIYILNNFNLNQYLNTENGIELQNNIFNFRTRKLIFTTNGFISSHFPHLDVKPARAQVLVTSKIHNLKLNGTFHHNKGFNYFRNIDGRILLGGGRDLNFDQEITSQMETTEDIQNYLEELLRTVIIPNSDFKIDYRWSGIMGVGSIKKPIIEKLEENIYCAVRMGGMGVAIGSKIGELAAEMISKDI